MDKEIEELLTRGVERIYPDKSALEKVLMSGKKIRLYYGIDPTGSTLHLGHLVQLLKLRKFQDLGHEVIILIGDFTAQIGDPTGKQATRRPLTHKQVLENAKNYKKQIGNILDLKKSNIRFAYNDKWTNKLAPVDMLALASHFTVSNLLTRDMFQERIKAGREIYVHEFLYPIFQAYDAVAMDVDLEIGGNDQMFNMLAGRDLMKRKKHKEMFVLTTKLLADPTGKKMGKTEVNMIALSDSADDMFGKIMSWPDDMIVLGFEICTNLDSGDFVQEKPYDQKIKLAHAIISVYHGEKLAEAAEKNFIETFSRGGIPKNIETVKINKNTPLVEVFLKHKIVSSKTEFNRLSKAGAIKEIGNGVYRIGKRRFLKIEAP
ncbi:MAG: tyrosine--tRNA ligase [Candidatus Zambryskibacteria bacterium]|nr:tyrosine--tRNA ligase [Candidatus Zambryskibacteria bacterium]